MMPRMTIAEVEARFRDAMRAGGLITEAAIHADGKLNRVRVEGDKAGSRNGWYILRGDGIPAGSFGSWKAGISETWRADIGRSLTPAEESDFRRRMDAARTAREADEARQRAETRKRAAHLWNEDAGRVRSKHLHLVAKGVCAYGLRQLKARLIVPVRDTAGELHGLQFLGEDGSKKFLTGTAKAGHYHSIGKPPSPGELLAIAEGYATGATVHEATGWAVAVAFDAGNLRSVAEALHAKYPQARIIIAADNDHRTPGNPGLTKAREAARAVGGIVIAPVFGAGAVCSDWNDHFQRYGSSATAAVLLNAASQTEAPNADRP